MNHRLEVDSVLLSYDNRVILSDIYLKVNTGDVVGILGRNGCGKSSLLKIIFGLTNAENKSVRLDGNYKPQLYKEKKTIKYLPQQPLLPENLNVVEAIDLFIESEMDKAEILSFKEINKLNNKKLRLLSGGEKRFLEVMLFLFTETKFLMLDEPFSHISPVQTEIISEYLHNQSRNKGIIITDHSYNYVLEVATRKYFLKDGHILPFQNKDELIDLGYLSDY
jgi:lipopolysaccharide export system ATP-binding protein